VLTLCCEVVIYTIVFIANNFLSPKIMIKNIYFFWYQGIQNAPFIVKQCLKSWYVYNPTWKIILLDESNYSQYSEMKYDDSMTITKFSDFLRLSILIKHGGLWVDSTCFCNKPLDEWLPETCFIFQNLKMPYEISTWFIYSEPDHILIKTWYDAANRIDKQTINERYFVFYEIFDKLCQEERFNDEWNKVKRIDQNDFMMYFDLLKKGNLHVQHDGFLEPITDNIKTMIENKEKYVFKLSYKYQGEILDNSILNFLFSTI